MNPDKRQFTRPTAPEFCVCGHAKEHHYRRRGICQLRVAGDFCVCARFVARAKTAEASQ